MTVELAYTDHGSDVEGMPVVLLHAFPLSAAMFTGVVSALAGQRRFILPDLRGFGDSPGPGLEEPSVEAMADDVAALLDRLGLQRVVVGGVSLGGYVAMAMLRRHRDRVGGVALIDTKAAADADEAKANRERVATAVLNHGTRALYPMLDTLLGETTRRERPDVVAQVRQWLDGARPDAVAWAQRAMAARAASFDTLAATDVPWVVIVGEEDELTGRSDAEALAGAFAQPGRPRLIAGAGHLAPVEQPDAVAGAVRDLLDEVR
ncbi:alpha/beta hydrolase [Haloactinopolyspora sp.]|uniref:alpha/beta fold hydrolase n=1 Tax=Haloactinopolyspora sp. TaxID=1966353 RepID=UPI00261589F9|nr:alpha/beta hydrolase [Haloactinopolyspora sp.]